MSKNEEKINFVSKSADCSKLQNKMKKTLKRVLCAITWLQAGGNPIKDI